MVVASLICCPLVAPGKDKPTEYDVKAAYLLNFGKFLRNAPGAPHDAFAICILGQDPITPALDDLTAGELIDGRPVRIVRAKDVTQARACQIVYLSASETPRLSKEIEDLRTADVLTVSDAPEFLANGGMIQFLLLTNHVRFAVNLDAVRRTHLELSSELLRVAYTAAGKPLVGGQQ